MATNIFVRAGPGEKSEQYDMIMNATGSISDRSKL